MIRSNTSLLKAVLTAALVLMTTSLFARINMTISSFGNYDFAGKHFYIIPADPNISPKDLEFKEYSQYVAALLRSSGAFEATDPATAEVCVLIDYLITDFNYVETVPVPIRDVVGKILTVDQSPDRSHTAVRSKDVYETVGYTSESKQVHKFRRVLNIYCYDNLDYEGDPDMLWKCNMVSDGSKNNLQIIIPALVYPVIGKAGQRVSIDSWLNEDVDWGGYIAFLYTMKDYLHASFPFYPVSVEPEARINYVIRNNGTLQVIVREVGPGKRVIAKDTYLSANGVDYPLTGADHIKVGGTNRFKEGETIFYVLKFQGVPADITSFDIVSPNKFTWSDIPLDR